MALQKSRHNYKSDDLLKLPAISNELSVTRKEDLKYSYAIPFSFCLLPCSICPLIQTWAEGLNSCCCLVLKLKLCNVFISLYMFLSALAPVVPTNIYHSSFYRRIYCSPIYTLNNLWYYCISTCPFQYNVRSSVPRILPFLKICYTIFFTNAPIFRKTSLYQNWHYRPIWVQL